MPRGFPASVTKRPGLSRSQAPGKRISGVKWRADFRADRAKDGAKRRWHSPEPQA